MDRITAESPVALASVFGPGMVLQREVPAALWGWAPPGHRFALSLEGRRAEVTAGPDGRWRADLPPLAPGGPFVLFADAWPLAGDVWVGDVWLLGGQSNMERSLAAGASWPTDPLGLRGDPGIRQLCLPLQFSWDGPADDLPGARWIGSDTDEVLRFSAVGFAFARDLRAQTGVPQGLLMTAVGGSTAQAWLSPQALAAFPRHAAEAALFARPGHRTSLAAAETLARDAWYAALEAEDPRDPRRAGTGPWAVVPFPSWWKDTPRGDVSGSTWYRRKLDLPASLQGEPGRLRLGTLVDADDVWVNGTWVGATGYQYPLRRYAVPGGVLKAGPNEILIRLVAPRGGGGITPDKPLTLEAGSLTLNLEGPWETRPGATLAPLAPDTFLPLVAGGLGPGLWAPLAPYTCRGVLWYQGESNLGDPSDYFDLTQAVQAEVRRLWNSPGLPWFTVQLPLFGVPSDGPEGGGWAEVRDAQRRLAGPDLVVALDQGEWNDIHPGNKAVVGQRLARLVLGRVFGLGPQPWTGPQVSRLEAGPGHLRLTFDEGGTGLTTRDGAAPGSFFLETDGGWLAPTAVRIEGASVVLETPRPESVRGVVYGWASNPGGAWLADGTGLPVPTFRVGSAPNSVSEAPPPRT